MERPSDTDDLSSLEAELDVWRKTRFDRLLTRRPPFRPAGLIKLAAQARRIAPERVRLQDVRATLAAVVAAIDQAASSASPSSQASRSAICGPGSIREIFGLTDASQNSSVRVREELAAGSISSTCSWQTIRKYHSAYVEQLAYWIRSQWQVPQRPTATGDTSPRVIPRPAELAWLHATYRRLMADGGGLFLLWGLDGMGKSTLAQRFADEIGPPRHIGFVRLGRRGLYEEDIRRILRLEDGLDTSTMPDDQCSARFRSMATRFKAIRLLVLDDARSEGDVCALVPSGCNVPVLVIAAENLRFNAFVEAAPLPSRRLDAVSDDETRAYLKDQLPSATDKTVDELVWNLGGHVETVHHVVRYLRSDGAMSAQELLDDIARRTQHALTDLAEVLDAPKCLPVVVDKLSGAVRGDPIANALLASLVWTHSSGERPRDLILEIVSRLVRKPSVLELQAAVRRLERLGLLATTETSFVIPRLTAHILRDLLIDVREHVLVAYERIIAEPPSEDERQGLLEVLRKEYLLLEPLRTSFAEMLHNTNKPPPAVLGLDDTTWVVFTTDDSGRRRVDLYGLTPRILLGLKAGDKQWTQIDDTGAQFVADLTAQVYPTIMTG